MPAFLNNIIQGVKNGASSLLSATKRRILRTLQAINNNRGKTFALSTAALTALDCYLDRPSVLQIPATTVVIGVMSTVPMGVFFLVTKAVEKKLAGPAPAAAHAHPAAPGL